MYKRQQLGTEEGSLEVTSEPLEDPSGPIESAERRTETAEMLRSTRQSADPTQQFASLALMSTVCTTQQTDPLTGSDDLAQPLVACDATSMQPLLLGEAPLLGQGDPNGPRLTGNEIDTSRPITGGFNPQTSQMEISFAFSQDGNPNGSQAWAQLTSDMIGQQVAITLDSQVISAPVIQGACLLYTSPSPRD